MLDKGRNRKYTFSNVNLWDWWLISLCFTVSNNCNWEKKIYFQNVFNRQKVLKLSSLFNTMKPESMFQLYALIDVINKKIGSWKKNITSLSVFLYMFNNNWYIY
jgi:hypothetical protein